MNSQHALSQFELAWLEVALVFVAFLVGWIGGRAHQRRSYRANEQNWTMREYYKGINLILKEQPDQAVDLFLKNFEVNSATLETYLALGGLFRRRGEPSRAIKIHQHLLASPGFNRHQQELIHLELARDYFYAGLYDRAQGLLNGLVEQGGRLRQAALSLLIQIHEQFKEWEQCKQLGLMLLKAGDETMLVRIAHYLCEEAELRFEANDLEGVAELVKEALQFDKRSLRVLILQARLQDHNGEYRSALRTIKRALSLDETIFPELAPLLKRVLHETGLEAELPSLIKAANPAGDDVELLEAYGLWLRESQGATAELEFLHERIFEQPYWRLFVRLIDDGLAQAPQLTWLGPLRAKVEQLLVQTSGYVCEHCGFHSKPRLWHCPSCRVWSMMQRVSEPMQLTLSASPSDSLKQT